MLKEAQIKVLELLEAHKISVESAAILLDAMNGKAHERQRNDSKESQRQNDTDIPSNAKKDTSQHKQNQQHQTETSEPSMEEVMNQTFKHVAASLRKASDKKQTTSKTSHDQKETASDTFSQIEKAFRDVTDKLNKYGK